MPELTKTQTVLDKDIKTTEHIFGQTIPVVQFLGIRRHPDDSSNSIVSVRLLKSAWEDLGEPDKITVSIEPGDVLND